MRTTLHSDAGDTHPAMGDEGRWRILSRAPAIGRKQKVITF